MKTNFSEKIEYLRPAGIICELNPPHTGHVNLFANTKKFGSATVCVMSGNFVQRGEPAAFPKRERALCAVEMGADIVVELPAAFALSPAETFARGGVSLLRALGAGTLVFGSESGDIAPIIRAADALDSPDADAIQRTALAGGSSYASARQSALETLIGADADVLRSPNNLLGVEYVRAIRHYSADMTAVTLSRTPGVSSSHIRDMLRRADPAAWGAVPESLHRTLQTAQPVFTDDLETAVLSRLRMLPFSAYLAAAGAADGVAERTFRAARTSGSLDELFAAVKTKRHAMSRIKRYVFAVALGLRAEMAPPYVRVLALSPRGGEILRGCAIPVITRPAAARKLGGEILRFMETESAATDLYALAYRDPRLRLGGSEWRLSAQLCDR